MYCIYTCSIMIFNNVNVLNLGLGVASGLGLGSGVVGGTSFTAGATGSVALKKKRQHSRKCSRHIHIST